MEDAARQAHTLKGISANLSLIRVRDITADLEIAVKNGSNYSALLADLKQAYAVTITRINEVIST